MVDRTERALAKSRKKIEKLVRKGKYAEAIDLQRQLCDEMPENVDAWRALAQLARDGARADLALAARFEEAKLTRATPNQWLALADEAASEGFGSDANEARFRAADGFAVQGDPRRAIELFDEVLKADPDHRQAQRIREVISTRLAQEAKDAGDDEFDEDLVGGANEGYNLSFVAEGFQPPSWSDNDDAEGGFQLAEMTHPTWMPPGEDQEQEIAKSPAGYVLNLQPWPTVLDDRALTFIGPIFALDPAGLDGLTEAVELPANSSVFVQGQVGELLYCLDAGECVVARHRGRPQELGAIKHASFFGEIGALAGLPNTTTVTTKTDCELRVVTRGRIRAELQARSTPPEVVSMLRNWYLETVFNICPLLRDDDGWPEGSDVQWLSFQPGELLSRQDKPGNFYIVVTGFASIALALESRRVPLGYLCPGDLCGEIDPSPVTVTAESAVTAVRLSRKRLPLLVGDMQAAFRERVAVIEAALESIRSRHGKDGD